MSRKRGMIPQYNTATEPEVEGSSGEAGSSWPGADAQLDDATVEKLLVTAEHGVTPVIAVFSGDGPSCRAELAAPALQQACLREKPGLLESQSKVP